MRHDIDLARRALLQGIVAAPAAVGLGSMLWGKEAWASTDAGLPDVDPVVHFLRRTTFGVRPAELTAASTSYRNTGGIAAYLEQQLGPMVDDPADVAARMYFPLAHLEGSAYWRMVLPEALVNKNGDLAIHWAAIAGQVVGNQVYRALFSERQLFEVMVQFWSNHLNTFEPAFKGSEQQRVIRAHALGNFRTMIEASLRDTAMSRYLNNGESRAPVPNQNYARELMELHTLGERRGYQQADVLQLSAILTGHTWDQSRISPTFGDYTYREEWHVGGDKLLMDVPIAGTGQGEADAALDVIFARPEVAEFIAYKLCRHFISDVPLNGVVPDTIAGIRPGDFVSQAAEVFRNPPNGAPPYDVKSVLRFILTSEQFFAAADHKLARPMECGVGILRAFDVLPTEVLPDDLTRYVQDLVTPAIPPQNRNLRNISANGVPKGVAEALVTFIRDAGNLPGCWPTPDGYPDEGSFWASATQFIARWNYIALECERDVKQEMVQSSPNGETRASRRAPAVPTRGRDLVKYMANNLLHRSLRLDHETTIAKFIAGEATPNRLLTAAEVQVWSSAVATILLSSPYQQLR